MHFSFVKTPGNQIFKRFVMLILDELDLEAKIAMLDARNKEMKRSKDM